MSDKIKPEDNQANISNANKGSSGTNRQYDQTKVTEGRSLIRTEKSSL